MITIEILGIGFPNKGAELMLAGISQWASQLPVETRLVVRWDAPFANRLQNRLWARIWHPLNGRLPYGHFANLWPKRLCDRIGIVRERDIDLFLDASGYAYGDPWGPWKAKDRLGSRIATWRHQGSHIVLLPQAFGPFKNPSLRAEMQRIIKYAHRIYARDDVSLEALKDLMPHGAEVARGHDFTCLVEPKAFVGMEEIKGSIGLIPNHKMFTFGAGINRTNYVEFFTRVARGLARDGHQLALILHEGKEDQLVCEEIHAACAGSARIVTLDDPREIKMAISLCQCVLTSRFHGFASGLFQAVPTLATSWSHKYKELAADFGVPDLVLEELNPEKTINLLKVMGADGGDLRRQLTVAAGRIKIQTMKMWKDIETLIESVLASGSKTVR